LSGTEEQNDYLFESMVCDNVSVRVSLTLIRNTPERLEQYKVKFIAENPDVDVVRKKYVSAEAADAARERRAAAKAAAAMDTNKSPNPTVHTH